MVPAAARAGPIVSIQGLRIVASLAVAAFHVNILFTDTGGGPWLSSLLSTGWLGVDVFFVVSGFIMWYSTGEQTRPTRFLTKRLTRIYTALWPALLITIALGTYTGKRPFDLVSVLRSATLLDLNPGPESMYLYITWTLSFELVFYLAFTLLLAVGRRHAFVLVAATVLVVEIAQYAQKNFGFEPLILFASRHYYEFILGGVVAAIHRRGVHTMALHLASLALGATLIVVGLWVDGWYDRNANILFVGGGTTLLLFGGLALEPYLRNRAGRALSRVGDWSYAMYPCIPPSSTR